MSKQLFIGVAIGAAMGTIVSIYRGDIPGIVWGLFIVAGGILLAFVKRNV